MMSFEDDFHDAVGLAKWVLSDRKKEKEQAEEARKTLSLTCPYCKTASKIVWKGGALPACPNCGAAFDVTEEMLNKMTAAQAGRVSEPAAPAPARKSGIRPLIIMGGVIILVMFIIAGIAAVRGGNFSFKGDATFHFGISQNLSQEPAPEAQAQDAGAEAE